ncbi:unnamed protein product [Protopolystoma xenopodis]|uniref:Uncharacterized protein n=1 Tax=Protopolystoma xenopodis TaxID=117903 RepID=A0A3S5FDI4_9PLAT|nr:unnamed protein product [Protopolystoma xenopodis]
MTELWFYSLTACNCSAQHLTPHSPPSTSPLQALSRTSITNPGLRSPTPGHPTRLPNSFPRPVCNVSTVLVSPFPLLALVLLRLPEE